MADELSGRRLRTSPEDVAAARKARDELVSRALDEGEHVASYRNTRWFKLGEDIVEVARRGYSGGGSNVAARGYSAGKLTARVVAAIPKYAELLGKMTSGVLGPPDVREASKKTRVDLPPKSRPNP